jgi:hypothetical protein
MIDRSHIVPHRAVRLISLASVAALSLAACATTPAAQTGDNSFASCPAYAPAYKVTDDFMRTFNSKDATAWGATFHFPSVRIASGTVKMINSAADLEDSFSRLEATGWRYSGWASRHVVQCDPTKAHMLTTFVRYRADGSELSRFNSLYIVEFKNDRWALTARSSFAP